MTKKLVKPAPGSFVESFEDNAYNGYVSYGWSMSDGIYRPISKDAFVANLRSNVPVSPSTFRHGSDFQPEESDCDRYNREVARVALFSGVYPTGIVYADRSKEEHGDYKNIAHLSFSTLKLTVYDPKSDLLDLVREDASKIQAKAGQEFQVSSSGQTVTLGFGLK